MNTVFPRLKRLHLLLGALGAAALLLAVRARFQAGQVLPSRSSTTVEKIRFYASRIKTNPEDVHAYVELGKLEESQEYYISALRRLYTARALGAMDRDIVLPLGRSLSHLARWDEARVELMKATSAMPDSVEAATNLAGVYFASGDASEAARVLDRFVSAHRNKNGTSTLGTEDLRRLMLCYSEAKDTTMAGTIANDVLKIEPRDIGALSIAGHALLVAGRYKEALPYLQTAVAIEPNVAALCYNYASALQHCGRDNEALAQYQRCATINPNASDTFVELAAIYEKRANWKLAAAAISNAALHVKSNYRVLFRAGKMNERAANIPESNYWYSNAALAAGKFQEALSYSQKLSERKEPSWRSAGLLNMAEAYAGLHRMPEYLAAIKKVAVHDTAQDYVRLAGAYERADLLDKQVEYLRRAMEKEPRLSSQAHSLIAQNLLRRGRRDDAEKELEISVSEDPQNVDYHTQLGSLYLERRYVGDRVKKAVLQFEQCVKIEPKEATHYQNLGIACSAANDLGRAAHYLEHAIDLQPGYGPSYEELGRVYSKMGDKQSSDAMLSLYRRYVRYDQQVKTLAARADQNKTDAGAQVELADLLLRSGDLGSALDRYSLALQLKPRDAQTRQKYDRVVQLITQSHDASQRKQ